MKKLLALAITLIATVAIAKGKPTPPAPTLIPSCTICDKSQSSYIYFSGSGYTPGDCIFIDIQDLNNGTDYSVGCACTVASDGTVNFAINDANLPSDPYSFCIYQIPQHWVKPVSPSVCVEITIQ